MRICYDNQVYAIPMAGLNRGGAIYLGGLVEIADEVLNRRERGSTRWTVDASRDLLSGFFLGLPVGSPRAKGFEFEQLLEDYTVVMECVKNQQFEINQQKIHDALVENGEGGTTQ